MSELNTQFVTNELALQSLDAHFDDSELDFDDRDTDADEGTQHGIEV